MNRSGSFGAAMACLVVLTTGCATHRTEGVIPVKVDQGATGFVNKTLATQNGERPYVVYVPCHYTPAKPWPLVLFLHGAGERGADGLLQTEVGIGRAIRRHADWFPCLVLMPQCPDGVWWDAERENIGAALDATLRDYAIDPARIYLTGLSMGGYGTWVCGAQRADLFAALMPICGGGNVADADKLAALPIWAFHGAQDQTVLPKKSREMVEAVQRAGGDVRYTEFPDAPHNSWDPAYDDPKTIQWLLDQRKR